MKKQISPIKWFLGMLSITLVLCIGLASITFFFDPACYYSLKEGSLIVNNFKFVNAGIIKNSEYDSVILGSSVSQNFDVDLVAEKLDLDPIKITGGGISFHTIGIMYDAIKNKNTAKTIIHDINLNGLNSDFDTAEGSYPKYLYDQNLLNDVKYLLGYEPLMKLIPFNIDYSIKEKMGEDIADVYATHNIDMLGNWDAVANYGSFKYKPGATIQNMFDIDKRMKRNADAFVDLLLKDADDTEFILFFPPSSAIYWYDARVCGHIDAFMNTKAYLVEKFDQYPNVTVYDFQTMPETLDLNNYKDNVHYSAEINDMMVEYFTTGEYVVTSENVKENNEKVISMIDVFAEKYADMLPQEVN